MRFKIGLLFTSVSSRFTTNKAFRTALADAEKRDLLIKTMGHVAQEPKHFPFAYLSKIFHYPLMMRFYWPSGTTR